jgi:hypothetical protein
MVEIEWTPLRDASPENEYIAFAGFTERRSVWTFLSYLMRARKIQGQLNNSKGLMGYTARMEFLSKKLINLTVWEKESDLKEFAHQGQHADCMEKTKGGLKPTEYISWKILGSQLPPTIDEAFRRREEQNK